MNCLTKHKIFIIEVLESIINDKRNILAFNFISEFLHFIFRISCDKSFVRNQNTFYYYLIRILIIIKTIFPFVHYYGQMFLSLDHILKLMTCYWNLLFICTGLILSFDRTFYYILQKLSLSDHSGLSLCCLLLCSPSYIFYFLPLALYSLEFFLFLSCVFIFYYYLFYLFVICYIVQFIFNRYNLLNGLKIAFIADGNRRYLKKHNLSQESVKSQGIYKIYEIAILCAKLRMKEVGFYCFSINNFNRPKAEIQNIMNVIINGSYKMKTNGVNIKFVVYGRLDLLQKEVRNELINLMESSKNNGDITVNLFIAYSTTDELQNGVQFKGNVDLVVRTSGEKRLSDFLVRQCSSGSHIFFACPFWPELTIGHVLLIIFKHKLEKMFFH